MEIRPKPSTITTPSIADVLRDVLAKVEAYVDKTPAAEIHIDTSDEFVAITEKMKTDRMMEARIGTDLQPFAGLAFKIHRTITGKINEYSGYPKDRIAAYDRALVDYDNRQEAATVELASNLKAQIETEDEQRRASEAAVLTERGEVEKAQQVLNAPKREVDVAVRSTTPAVKGFGIKKSYVATCVDEDRLMLAVARPAVYREVAAWIEAELLKTATNPAGKKIVAAIVQAIKAQANTFPVIPSSAFVSTKGSRDALNTRLSKFANDVNGKMEWPGVAVEEEKKSSQRTR